MERDLVVENLHTLGQSGLNGKYAYLGLNLSGCPYLPEILDVVARYKHLQTVDLSKGYFHSLRPLAALTSIRELNLHHSNIKTLEDFGASACPTIGSESLEQLDVSNNQIEEMPKKLQLHFLRELRLGYNKITHLRGLDGIQFLCVLDLSNNKLTSASSRHLSAVSGSLRELYLNDNKIYNLDEAFRMCERLQILNLARNGISHIEKLDACVSLRSLDLGGNFLCGIRQMEYLVNLRQLYELDLSDNELTAAIDYRSRVLHRLDRLMWLDGAETCSEERVKATNVYGGQELASRKANHDEHGLPFTNPMRVWMENRARPTLLHSEVRTDLAGYENLKLRVEMWNEGEDCLLPDGTMHKEGVVVHVHTTTDADVVSPHKLAALHGSFKEVAHTLGSSLDTVAHALGPEFNLLPLRIRGDEPDFDDVIRSMTLTDPDAADADSKNNKAKDREKKRRERQVKAMRKAQDKALSVAQEQADAVGVVGTHNHTHTHIHTHTRTHMSDSGCSWT